MGESNGKPNGAKSIETRLFINGKLVESSEGKTFAVVNPATEEVVANVHEATEADTNAAVAAAKAAQPAWAATPISVRAACFRKLASLIRAQAQELAALEAQSMGRPVSSYFDAYYAADTFEYFAEAAYNLQGTTSLNTPGFVNMTFRQPFGVVAGIIPWNLPLIFFVNKVAPAVAVGNTIVLKSSEKAPLTCCAISSLVAEAGFPPGVINIIAGYGQTSGSVLSHHMDVRALSFTGSTRTGRLIQAASAKSNLKAVMLELGGKTPAIVFEDADIDAAAQATQFSIAMNSGQTCMANSRVYVQDSIAEQFVRVFKEKFTVGDGDVGDPMAVATRQGPQADKLQFEAVKKYLDIGKKEGKVEMGGSAVEDGKKGFFVNRSIFRDTPESSPFMKEEIFGPVVNISVFSTEEEVLKKANDTEYGLYASVFTKDLARAMRCAKALEAGTVGVNCTSPTIAHDMPFGGYKGSGLGREGLPFNSLDNYLEVKTVLIKIE